MLKPYLVRSPEGDFPSGGGNDNPVETDFDDSPNPATPEAKASPEVAKPEPVKEDSYSELLKTLKEQVELTKKSQEVKPVEAKKLTPEEIEASYGRFKLSKDDLAEMGFLEASPELVAGFQKRFDAAMDYASKKAEALISEKLGLAEKSYSPILQEYQARQQDLAVKSFFDSNKDLDEHRDLVALVAQAAQSNPSISQLPPDKLASAIAEGARRILKSQNISTKPIPNPTLQPNKLGGSGSRVESKPAKPSDPRSSQAASAANIFG